MKCLFGLAIVLKYIFCTIAYSAISEAASDNNGTTLVLPQSSNDSVISDQNSTLSRTRQGRAFPFYSLGRIKNVQCTGTNGLTGTCQIRGECAANGGLASGQCDPLTKQAVCCIYSGTCGGTSSNTVTYFQNTGYPATFNGGTSCSFTITPPDNTVCQLRIDFTAFSLSQPNAVGVCNVDNMQISGGVPPAITTMCGDNNGQHLYVAFSGTNSITVTIATSAATSFNRVWNLQMTQILCTSQNQAPPGCLQYFSGTSGDIYSFNYGGAANPAMNAMGMAGTRQLANQNYGICIQNAAGYCTISYNIPATDPFAFTLTGDVTAIAPAMLGTPGVGAVGTACTTDFLIFPNPVGLTTERFCGLGMPATITSGTTPFVLYYVTDAAEVGDVANRGFHLQYTQNACPIPGVG